MDGRRPFSIIPDDARLDVGNDDLYPAPETRFKEWDAYILTSLEFKRDLGLSQPDKDWWDSVLQKMISLRNIYNERRRTGREDLEVPQTTVHKSVQTLNEVEDVGTQVMETDMAALNGTEERDLVTFNSTSDQGGAGDNSSSQPSTCRTSFSNREMEQGEGGEGSSGGIEAKVEVNEDNHGHTSQIMVYLDDIDKEEEDSSNENEKSGNAENAACPTQNHAMTTRLATQKVNDSFSPAPSSSRKSNESSTTGKGQGRTKSANPLMDPGRSHRNDGQLSNANEVKSACSSSEKVNSSLPPSSSSSRKRKSCTSRKSQGRARPKKPAMEQPPPNPNGDHETPSTSRNSSLPGTSKNSETPSRGGNHMLPNLPTWYMNRRIRMLKGRKRFPTEEKFLHAVAENITHKTIAIHGPSYMGKTTFLVKVGRNILRDFPERKVFYLEIKNVVDAMKTELENREMSINTEVIWTALRRLTRESELGKANPATKTELFFDEFDNVQDGDWNLVCDILICVSGSFESTGIRMWFTTNSEDFDRVGKKISNVESYSIEPLDDASQIELMASYLKVHTSKSKSTLLRFATECVKDLFSSSSKSDLQLELGNPLQCLLIGAACLSEKISTDSKNSSLFKSKNILDINDFQENLLIDAALNRSFHTLKLVLSLNKFSINCVDSDGDIPLFLSIFAKDNVDCLLKLKLLIEQGANLNHFNKCNYNLLNFAARYASVESMNYIMSLNEFDINSVDINGAIPVFNSVSVKDNVDSLLKLKLLIEKGANLDHLNTNNDNLLLFAAGYGSVKSLKYILSLNQFDVNCIDKYGNTPLFLSADGIRNVDCLLKLKLLIEKGANLDHLNNNNDLLFHAARNATADVLEYILRMDKFLINSENTDGFTPLTLSIFQFNGIDCLKKLKLLVDRGAKLNSVNKNGSNLLHLVAQNASIGVLKYVLSLDKFDINSVDSFGNTALDYAKGEEGVKGFDTKAKVKLLLEKGCVAQG